MSDFNPEVRFRHFEFADGGHVTVAYKLDDNRGADMRHVRVSAAFCSPKDQFKKKTGRRISSGRLETGKYVDAVMPIHDDESFLYQVTDFVEDCILSGMVPLPNWVARFVE